MYLRLIILALLFLFSERSNAETFHFSPMEISDALPVQFWLVGCATYNEHIADGVHHKCWCAPWECDDIIKIQFKDDPSGSFSLLIYDENEQEIGEIDIEETSVGVYELDYIPSDASPGVCDEKIQLKIRQNAHETDVPVSLPPLTDYDTTTSAAPTLAALSSWVNAGGPNPGTWTLSATPDITVNGAAGVSGYIAGAITTDPNFNYEFNVQFEIFGDGSETENIDVTFALLDSSFIEVDTHLINYSSIGVKTPNFTLNGTSAGAYLAMRITNNTPTESKSFELQSASYVPGDVSYDWTLGASPTVNLPGTGPFPPNSKESELLYVDYAFIAGEEYTITAQYTRVVNSGSSNPRTSQLLILNSSDVTQFSNSHAASAGSNTLSVTFVATASTTRIGFTHESGSNVDITINSITGTILETTGTTAFIAKTDCLYITQNQEDTILLTYSNHRNFAGLVYESVSPENEFYIRIPAIFFHQRFPEEDETMELSTSLVTLNGTLRKQRLLDVDYVPYYFHEKLKLILKHQILEVFNRQWVKQEGYEIVEGERRWPVKKAKCWLSEKDFVHRNIL